MEDIEALVAEAVSREMEKFRNEIGQLKGETEKLKKENHELRVMVKKSINANVGVAPQRRILPLRPSRQSLALYAAAAYWTTL